MAKWAEIAQTVMVEILLRCESQGLNREETAKAIDAEYPFGERAHHPYKVWLKERKDFFSRHGLPRNGDHRTQKDRMNDLVAKMNARRHWS